MIIKLIAVLVLFIVSQTPAMRTLFLFVATLLLSAPDGSSQDGSRLGQAFQRVDTDSDGKLSMEERDRFPPLRSRLEGADQDADGFLSFQEFAMAIAQSQRPSNPETSEDFGPGDHLRTVEVGERERRYQVHVPPSYTADRETPVVIAFHGGGGNPRSMVPLSGLNEKADEAGFLVVYPYGTGTNPDRGLTFNGGECCGYAMHNEVDDVGFVRALLDDLATVAAIDESSIFATGLSNGGIVAYRVAAELSERIAAIAPVGGPLMMETIAPSQPVAVMHFHGTADRFAPFDGGYGTNRQGGRGVTEFRSVDHSIQAWVRANECDETPEVDVLPDAAPDDGTRVTRKTWGNGRNGTEVVLIEIEGGGHTWPGVPPAGAASFLGTSTRDISANDLMWDFFQEHRREAPAADAAGGEVGAKGQAMELLRTPDESFAGLPEYDFEPRYLFVDDPNLPTGNKRIRMHYAVSGPADAPILLMLHGNPSWSFLFRKVVPPINEAGYRTILIDYVGHGRSDKPSDESDYSYERHLEWLRQAFSQLDNDPELNLKSVVLFGHDYGHPLGARLMAEHYPERFDGFINGNAGLNRGRFGLAQRHSRWRQFVRSVPKVPIGAVICRNQARERLGLPPCPEEVEAGYDAPYPTGDHQASIRAFPEMVPEDATWPEAQANQRAWDYLTGAFSQPYMVIWESFDIPDFKNRRSEYISDIPGAFGLEQPQLRTGHYSPEDDPEGVSGAVIRFLDDIYHPHRFREVLHATFSKNLEGFARQDEGVVHDAEKEAVRLVPGAALEQRQPMDLSRSDEWKVAFRYLPEGVPAEAKLLVDLWNNKTWTNLLTLTPGSDSGEGDFRNGSTDYGYLRLKRDVVFSQDAKIRFRLESPDGDAAIFLKEVGVYERPKTKRTHP